MSLSNALLGLLEPAPRHGYDLRQEYDERFGTQKPIKPGQVYATLGRLRRDGAIAVASVDREDGPDRISYNLTPTGSRHLESWFRRAELPTPYLQSTVHTKVILSILTGRDPVKVLLAQRASHVASMRSITRMKSGADLSTTLNCDYTIFHLEADLRWVEHTMARLDKLRGELT